MKKIIQAMPAVFLLALPYLLVMLPGTVAQIMGVKLPGDGAYIMDNEMTGAFNTAFVIAAVMYGIIVLINVIWLIYQTASGVSAQSLLFWNMLIKLCYIPVFLYAFITLLAGMVMFMFGGIVMIAMAVLAIVLFFLPPCIYGLCGCIRAAKEGTMGKGLAIVMAIMQFILCIDVIAAVVAYCMVRSSNKKRLREQMNVNTYYNGTMYPNGNGYHGNGYMR